MPTKNCDPFSCIVAVIFGQEVVSASTFAIHRITGDHAVTCAVPIKVAIYRLILAVTTLIHAVEVLILAVALAILAVAHPILAVATLILAVVILGLVAVVVLFVELMILGVIAVESDNPHVPEHFKPAHFSS